MKKVKAILTCFRNSAIPNDLFYPKLLHMHFFTSLHYFLSIVIGVILFCIFVTFINYNPFVIYEYKTSLLKTINSYPPNAIINIYNNTLQTIDKKPILMWIDIFHNKRLLFVADSSLRVPSPNQFPSLFVLGSDKLFIQLNSKIYSIPYSIDLSITKKNFDLIKDRIEKTYFILLIAFYLFLLIAVPFFFIVWIVGSVTISSCVIYLYSIFTQQKKSFRKIIQVGLHSSIIPICIGTFFYLLLPIHRSTPIATLFLFLIFHAVAMYEAYSKMPTLKTDLRKHRGLKKL